MARLRKSSRDLLARCNEVGDFPRKTCAASLHVMAMAEELVRGRIPGDYREEWVRAGDSMLAVVAMLWGMRSEALRRDAVNADLRLELERANAKVKALRKKGRP